MQQDNRQPLDRLPWVFGILVLLVGAAALALGANVESAKVPVLPFRVGSRLIVAVGTIFSLTGILILFLPRRLGSRVGLLCSILALATASGFAWSFRGPARGDIEFDLFRPRKTWSSKEEWTERYIDLDGRFGHKGIPEITAVHRHREFEVTYSHGGDGWRRMPAAKRSPPRGEIVFLGCSYTYGVGVEDDQTYSYLLAANAWTDFEVVNMSCPGWGTNHLSLALEDLLSQSEKPLGVFYAFFDGHFQRNGERASWHGRIKMPFPLVDRQGNHQGIKPSSFAQKADTFALDQEERQITATMIRKMNDACRQARVPFVVLVLQVQNEKDMEVLTEIPELHWIDLRPICDEYFRHDGHPTPRSHRAIAWALANDPRVAEIIGQPTLYSPTAFSREMFDPDALRLQFYSPHEGNAATLVRGGDDATKVVKREEGSPAREANAFSRKDWVRVENIALSTPKPSVIQLAGWLPGIQQGARYEYSLRARADRPRTAVMGIFNRIPPLRPLAPTNIIELFPDWREYKFSFVALEEETATALRLSLGNSDVPIEVAEVRLQAASDLLPGAFTLDTPCAASGIQARLTRDEQGAYRVDEIVTSPKPWCLQCTRRGVGFESGRSYRLKARIRSDAPRSVILTCFPGNPPLHDLGLHRRVDVTEDWREIGLDFVATRTEAEGMINIQFADGPIPFEFSDVEVEER